MSLDVYLDDVDKCPQCGHKYEVVGCTFQYNITHNLNEMAMEAGIYKHLWRPEELGISAAGELVKPLRAGLELLRRDRGRFEAFNPSNGWGDYDGLVEFVAKYLDACIASPDATIHISR